MGWFERDGVRLYYQLHGQGLPLILTHGASWDHGQWAPQVAALAPQYRVIVWDVRGHGQSALPPGPVDADDFHRDLVALLDHLALPRAVLGGLSMGGHISLRAAARHPERAAALILIGTPFTNSYNWYERLFVPVNRLSQRLMPMSTIARSQARAMSDRQEVRAYAQATAGQLSHDRWVRLWNAVTRMESRADLPRIACPTLILEGENDWLTHRQQAELAASIAGAQHRIIPDAGHATNLDNPEAVNRAIAEFLDDMSL
jgi:pimeloyl-ACP methyl ester carboxylesterase